MQDAQVADLILTLCTTSAESRRGGSRFRSSSGIIQRILFCGVMNNADASQAALCITGVTLPDLDHTSCRLTSSICDVFVGMRPRS